MTTRATAPRAAGQVGQDWERLGASTERPDPFEQAMLDGLPEPARRWLSHVITGGTPLYH